MSDPLAFSYAAQPMDVTFGAGSISGLRAEVEALGLTRVIVLSTPGQAGLAGEIAAQLGPLVGAIFTKATMHVPIEIVDEAASVVAKVGADGCVAVGGGSTIGLGKALSLRHRIPTVAVPTTYAGSEMTPVWGITENGVKTTGRDRVVLPVKVIYDPELSLALPLGISATSGMNAIAHAVEALWAPDRSPLISLMAEEGVRAIATALPQLKHGADLAGRSNLLYGAWLCGSCLGATTMSLHHKLCHILGGTFNLPHADTHTIVLPYVLEYNAPAAPQAVAALQRALGTDDPVAGLITLRQDWDVPSSLKQLGLTQNDLETAVDAAIASPYANPREVTAEGLRTLLARAWSGALG
ncbi:maleylacetate reductase [Leifsonia kafniensis]|uniref:Maleylacetate reductase n=1 Tax=Leifsonia kafniensis TaxID=475957 RepID=A0ABP7KT37_9MICO